MKRSALKRKPFKKKPYKKKPIRKKLQDKAWKLMSQYVRNRDQKCITCGSTSNLQAGHFIHGKLDFDFQNIHAQCRQCNYFKSGNLALYATFLVREYGWDILEELQKKASVVYKYTAEDYEAIIQNLEWLLKEQESK